MDHREVQLSHAESTLDALASYQQSPLGPGMSKILEHQQRHAEGEDMKKRTRLLYALLGVVLLFVYFTILKRTHFFEKHPIVLPASLESEKEEIGSISALRV